MTFALLLIGSILSLVFSIIPAAMFIANLPLFRFIDTTPDTHTSDDHVSVLIPARNESDAIESSVRAALASERVTVEVIVLDDHSTDTTADQVHRMQREDNRVRYRLGAELPDGWNGKQHACKQLADIAKYERIVFIDADVRLKPDALIRLANRQDGTGAALLSAFPHQETGTLLEKWLIPMMHFILLGFLPFQRMRDSAHPAYASGCGQLFMTKRGDYAASGTHAAIHDSRHDGIKLPKAYRTAGLMTDVIDGTDLAECRMYTSASQVIRGLLKNATEGIANARLIVPFTVLLLGGTLLPLVVTLIAWNTNHMTIACVSLVATLINHLPRILAASNFRQSWLGVICHVPATALFVVLQWIALAMSLAGRQVKWRGRS